MDCLIKNPGLLWFLIGIVLMLLEFVIPGFVIIFFGIGAVITAILTWLGILQSSNLQIVIFIVSSLGTLIIFRNKGKKYFMGGSTKAKEEGKLSDEIIGEKAIVAEEINPDNLTGKVELHGTMWNASSDSVIPKGIAVKIVGRKDLTLIVKKLSDE
jgi:membrane protein implicated in regulation of membrane protease activity